MTSKLIVVAGSLAQRPRKGGHTWVFLQYLLGFKRLGWEVLFLDRLDPSMCFDRAGRPCSLAHSDNLAYLQEVLSAFGLGDSYSLVYNAGEQYVGLSRDEVLTRVGRSTFLLNVMGFLDDEAILAAAPLRVFLDIDPGFGQMWRELGLHDPFRGHDRFVTIGENIGKPDCHIPTCGLDWITTPQPVVLEQWPVQAEGRYAFTSIGAWRGPYGPVEYNGRSYGLRVHEFRKFVELPRLSGHEFEVALDIHPSETRDLALLEANGWTLTDPTIIAADPWVYRDYVQSSRAEFMVAKNMYVQSNSGWFSDRTICYLASGKPALAQDTGIGQLYPVGEGLITFSTLDEALQGVDELTRNYTRHTVAARAMAEEYFDSDKVLSALLAKLGIG